MIYTLDDLRAQIDGHAFELGWRWFGDGRVTAPNVQRGGEIVTTVIRQPGRGLLRVSLWFAGTPTRPSSTANAPVLRGVTAGT